MRSLNKQAYSSLEQFDLCKRDETPDIDRLCKQLSYQNLLHPRVMLSLINKCRNITNNEPNMLNLNDPVTIIGDIHGQFSDLLKILSHDNMIEIELNPSHKILFLGDYVDRGINSVEIVTLLICLKINYPQNIFLLRGNHESRIMSISYNFRQECLQKYSIEVYDAIMQFFDTLPLACVVNKSYFCVHGGISDKLDDIQQVLYLNRNIETPLKQDTAFCDLIWSDPIANQDGNLQGRKITTFNNARECSIIFGIDLVNSFLAKNKLKTIIRAHEVFFQGFNLYKWNQNIIPPLITVFSAPNYCGNTGNKGAILKISENSFKIRQFEQNPPQKQKFLMSFDVFSWTLPQIMTSVDQITMLLMKSLVDTKFPQLKVYSQEKQLQLLIWFANKQYKRSRTLRVKAKSLQLPLDMQIRPKSYQQMGDNMYRRSLLYNSQKQKLPRR